jgi:hypothetical protein
MDEHIYIYPTVVELRGGRGARGMPRDAGADLYSQPPVTDRVGQRTAQSQTVESEHPAS